HLETSVANRDSLGGTPVSWIPFHQPWLRVGRFRWQRVFAVHRATKFRHGRAIPPSGGASPQEGATPRGELRPRRQDVPELKVRTGRGKYLRSDSPGKA